jgi:hypothetical protein
VARARSEFFKGKPARWRMAEPCALIIIFVTLGMILPLFFPCTPTQARCCCCAACLPVPLLLLCARMCDCLPVLLVVGPCVPDCMLACPPCLPAPSAAPFKTAGGLKFYSGGSLDPAGLHVLLLPAFTCALLCSALPCPITPACLLQCVIIQGETKPLCPDGTSDRIK